MLSKKSRKVDTFLNFFSKYFFHKKRDDSLLETVSIYNKERAIDVSKCGMILYERKESDETHLQHQNQKTQLSFSLFIEKGLICMCIFSFCVRQNSLIVSVKKGNQGVGFLIANFQ